MTDARFLQIHTLHGYTAALLNRDDSGLAKRLPFGGVLRTRVSSQCLKRHWRMEREDPHALLSIDGVPAAFRSRELVTRKVIDPLRQEFGNEIADALDTSFQKAVYGDKGEKKDGRQTLLLGEPEMNWLANEARRLAKEANGDAKTAGKAAEEWQKEFKKNIHAMREQTKLPGGISSALFGRMVTSDVEANIDAAIHVAHAFTVHGEEAESDYFTAVDDLKREEDDSGADLIQETELTSGLFYGYVVVDIPTLLENLGQDAELAGQVVHNLLYLIAEVSPGAKLGSTAPYGRADLMLVEAGARQPRSLANAFRDPSRPETAEAIERLSTHLQKLDETYATGEERRYLTPWNGDIPNAQRGTMSDLANWSADVIRNRGTA